MVLSDYVCRCMLSPSAFVADPATRLHLVGQQRWCSTVAVWFLCFGQTSVLPGKIHFKLYTMRSGAVIMEESAVFVAPILLFYVGSVKGLLQCLLELASKRSPFCVLIDHSP